MRKKTSGRRILLPDSFYFTSFNWIHPLGHTLVHLPQPMQAASFTAENFPIQTVTAFLVHAFMHAPQPTHLSLFTFATLTGATGAICIVSFVHSFYQNSRFSLRQQYLF